MAKNNNTCLECGQNCLGIESTSHCVEYLGNNIPEYGIESGMCMTEVIQRLAPTSTESTSESATSTTITASDVECNSGSSASACVSEISDRGFDYSIASEGNVTTFSYNATGLVSNLPADYTVIASSIKAFGEVVNGSSSIVNSSGLASSFPIDLDRFPVSVDLDIRLSTPCGNISLTKTIYIPCPSNESYRGSFEVSDLVANSGTVSNVDSEIKSLTAKISNLESIISTLTRSNPAYDGNTLQGFTSSLIGRIKVLEEDVDGFQDTILICDPDCDDRLEGTICELIADLNSKIKEKDDEISVLSTTLSNLSDKVNALEALSS